MFESLSQRLTDTLQHLRGRGRLTEDNIKDAIRDIRVSFLEADVALPVVKQFIEQVREQAIGEKVLSSVNPGQAFTKIVSDELTALLGQEVIELDLTTSPPAVILLAGLQGSGKTTSAAKLARYLQQQDKKVMLTSCDIYRPAAIDQLATLSQQVKAEFYPSTPSQRPDTIAENAIHEAKKTQCDVLIIDTAGRLHVDDEMMDEVKRLHALTQPIETLFVVDSMTGQDAANTAKAFHDALPLTGVILTKIDGDARGGAALSIRHITETPIKFIGVGEKTDALEPFYPDRIASRILGMGDVVSLVEEAEQKLGKKAAEKAAKKLKKGKGFNLQDFREQIQQLNQMGGMMSMLSKLPNIGPLGQLTKQVDNKSFTQIVAIIDSMTLKERYFPALINGSRKRRIAKGSGTQIQDINRLLKQFEKMQKMMKKMAKPGAMKKMMRGLPEGMLPKDLL